MIILYGNLYEVSLVYNCVVLVSLVLMICCMLWILLEWMWMVMALEIGLSKCSLYLLVIYIMVMGRKARQLYNIVFV